MFRFIKEFLFNHIKQNYIECVSVHRKDGKNVHFCCRQLFIYFQGRASVFIFKVNERGLRRKEDDEVHHCVLLPSLSMTHLSQTLLLTLRYNLLQKSAYV